MKVFLDEKKEAICLINIAAAMNAAMVNKPVGTSASKIFASEKKTRNANKDFFVSRNR